MGRTPHQHRRHARARRLRRRGRASPVDGGLSAASRLRGGGPDATNSLCDEAAFAQGLKPIVVINKIDREGARPDWVLDQTFDLFDRLGATDEQLDFPVIYASAVSGYASDDDSVREGNMHPLLDAIVEQVPPPPVDSQGPFQMQISSLDYSSYVGAIGIGLNPTRLGEDQHAYSIDRPRRQTARRTNSSGNAFSRIRAGSGRRSERGRHRGYQRHRGHSNFGHAL